MINLHEFKSLPFTMTDSPSTVLLQLYTCVAFLRFNVMPEGSTALLLLRGSRTILPATTTTLNKKTALGCKCNHWLSNALSYMGLSQVGILRKAALCK